jgi:hypothetical protein
MSWAALIDLITRELGENIAGRIDRLARMELRGVRITVPSRVPISRERIEATAPGRPQEAAKLLEVHPATVYRALRARRTLIR